jgi:sterol desaturase/sphingolipid hydroxylase (fatty acid hydroxylase superfamily)
MKEFKIDNKGSGRLFKNRFLERLTRTNFSVPVVFYLAVGIITIVYSLHAFSLSFLTYLLLFPAGMLLFSLVEYLLHRFVFHFRATTESQLKIQYNIHGIHHEFPRDKDRLVMPPVISVFLAFAFFLLFTLLFRGPGYVIFGGFVTGYSIYLLIHYAVHARKPPRNFLKLFWKHHSLHHYASVDSAFSVSFPLWDKLFGTMPPSDKTAAARLPDGDE